MSIHFQSNNRELSQYLQQQQGKPASKDSVKKAVEIARTTSNKGADTGVKHLDAKELADIEQALNIDIIDKHEQGAFKTQQGQAQTSFSFADDDMVFVQEEQATQVSLNAAQTYGKKLPAKFANYQRTSFGPTLTSKAANHKEIVDTAKEVAKFYDVPPAFLVASFGIETHPDSYDVGQKGPLTYMQKEDLKKEGTQFYARAHGMEEWWPVSNEEAYKIQHQEFHIGGWNYGGLDNDTWLKGLPLEKGKDYFTFPSVNEKGEDIDVPHFKTGKALLKAQMMAFGRKVSEYYKQAQSEGWKNFEADAPYVLARLAYNAGPHSSSLKNALEFYKNGSGDTLPRVRPGTNTESNLEHALKTLYGVIDKGIDPRRPSEVE